MNDNDHPAIAAIESEFEKHISSRQPGPFTASPETNTAFSKLTRDLETARQIGALTATEKKWLAAIDNIAEKIARYNQAIGMGEESGKTEEPAEVSTLPVFIPNISQDMASNIIHGIDKQFKEKVLSKLNRPTVPEPVLEPSHESTGVPDGRSLHDYLTTMRNNLPAVPFSDEDSFKDLSRTYDATSRQKN